MIGRALAIALGLSALSVAASAAPTADADPFATAGIAAEVPSGPRPTAAFLPGAGATATTARFEGRLTLTPGAAPDGWRVLRGAPTRPGDPRLAWPVLVVDLVQDGDRLIPARRGPIPGGSPAWDWLISPGRVWREPADGDFSRVALPIALEERNANCVHNGRMLLLFAADGRVSRAAVQFDTEICAYLHFDAWSLIQAAYAPGRVAGAETLIRRDRSERAGRPPLRALADLTAVHPGLDLAALARAAGPSAVWGLDDGAIHYAAPCTTRAGEDPDCAERALPSYSTAKTLVGMQALFSLETRAPGASRARVADLAPTCAAAGGWGDVSLIDLLDMASGHFVSSGPETDEDSPTTARFLAAPTATQKIAFACGQPRAAPPGRVWVYHTADSFLLGVAMTELIRRSGLGDDVYDDLVRPIWRSMGQSAALDDTRRTYDAAAQPFTGWGLTYTRDDALRAARFLSAGGLSGGRAWLAPDLLAEAMQETAPGGGFEALDLPYLRYRHGLWARDIAPLIHCRRPVWTPFLSGYGGISIVLFPNRVTFYAFNDAGHFDWGPAAPEANRIRAMCP